MPNLIDLSKNMLSDKITRVAALMSSGTVPPMNELDNMLAINDIIDLIPGPFGQKNLADQSIAYLHYRCAYGDFYVTEKVSDSHLSDLYGVIVNDNGQVFGYISTKALFAANALLDMDFRPTKVADIYTAAETSMLTA